MKIFSKMRDVFLKKLYDFVLAEHQKRMKNTF